jgi:hypothetical protein
LTLDSPVSGIAPRVADTFNRGQFQRKNKVYGTLCLKLTINSPNMSTPESTPSHLPRATLCQSRLYPPVRDLAFVLCSNAITAAEEKTYYQDFCETLPICQNFDYFSTEIKQFPFSRGKKIAEHLFSRANSQERSQDFCKENTFKGLVARCHSFDLF